VVLITVVGIVIILVGLFWTGKYFSQSGAAKVAGMEVTLPAGFFVMLVGIAVVVFPYSPWYNDRSNPTPPTTTGAFPPVPPSTSSPTTQADTTQADTKIRFASPKPNSSKPPPVGRVVNVIGFGKIPDGKHLWIFVYAPDTKLYYAAGEASPLPDSWTFSGVVLGGNVPSDINVLYTIYAVVTDSNAHATIGRAFKKNEGTTGTPEVPGGSGSEKVAYVTVKRVR
jgi:hypothetical protein